MSVTKEEMILESIALHESYIEENKVYLNAIYKQIEEDSRRKKPLYVKDSFKEQEDHFKSIIESSERLIKIRKLQLVGMTYEDAEKRVDQDDQPTLF